MAHLAYSLVPVHDFPTQIVPPCVLCCVHCCACVLRSGTLCTTSLALPQTCVTLDAAMPLYHSPPPTARLRLSQAQPCTDISRPYITGWTGVVMRMRSHLCRSSSCESRMRMCICTVSMKGRSLVFLLVLLASLPGWYVFGDVLSVCWSVPSRR